MTRNKVQNIEANQLWDFILINEITSEEALQLVTDINGYSVETLNDVIYAKTSYHDIEQLWDCERENLDWSCIE